MLAVSRFRRGPSSPEPAGTATIVGWALVFVAPPVVYVLALASNFSVQASIFAALMAATGLLWIFSLVEELSRAADRRPSVRCSSGWPRRRWRCRGSPRRA